MLLAGFYVTYIWQSAMAFVVIETVADYELVRDFETVVIDFEIEGAVDVFEKHGGDTDRGRVALFEEFHQFEKG